jgi:very-short-patch-repair endonuclease
MDSEQLLFTAEREKMHYARALRRTMTKAEKILWDALHGRKFHRFKFRRQAPIGSYIADFLCKAHCLIIEIDGSIHEKQRRYDHEREEELLDSGYRILHFQNHEVQHNLPAVLRHIEHTIFPPRSEEM